MELCNQTKLLCTSKNLRLLPTTFHLDDNSADFSAVSLTLEGGSEIADGIGRINIYLQPIFDPSGKLREVAFITVNQDELCAFAVEGRSQDAP